MDGDAKFLSLFRDLWNDHGHDIDKWPIGARCALVAEWYACDERQAAIRAGGTGSNRGSAIPDWICDALSDLSCDKDFRELVIEEIRRRPLDAVKAVENIGVRVLSVVATFPLASLQGILNDREPEWIAWRRREAEKGEADSRNDAAGLH